MNAGRLMKIAATAMVLGAPVIGGPVLLGGLAVASGKVETADAKKAAKSAQAARKALKKGKGQLAVTLAEAAVAFDPKNGEYRKLLGETYLFTGRFISAAQALNEALSLNPTDGRTALNLVLAQVATGEWTTARQTLETYAATIPASDRGLAFALAGDPGTAIALLGDAARQPGADAKTRQNLALSFALAGQWQQAKAVAAVDLPADQVDARIMQWATFARPQNAYDQVASLLNVTPIADAGQPERLALSRSLPVAVAAQQATSPVDAFMPGQTAVDTAVAAPTPAPVSDPETAAPVEVAAPSGGQVVFAERKEISQRVPVIAPVERQTAVKPIVAVKASAVNTPVRKVEAVAFVPAKGEWFVQLGAYDNSGVARDAWGRVVRRVPALSGMTPFAAAVKTEAGSFQRLAVGGFSRADAVKLCGKVRAKGGACFVRAGAGDQVASWSKSAVRFASR